MKTMIAITFLASWMAAGAQAQENTYLEIPIEGRFGDQVTARGVEDALKIAECLQAKHIVFSIDSKGGDQVVARDLYNILRKYDKAFRFHAVVKEATGVALAPVVWCETVFIRPGGRVGGVNLIIDEDRYSGIEPGVVLMNVALNAGEEARRHGRSAELVRAMIDPTEAVTAWRDNDCKVCVSKGMPDGIPGEEFIVMHMPGTVLTLSDRQAVDLEFAAPYDGDVAGLGQRLGLAGWVSAGEDGRRSMAKATQAETVKTAAALTDRRTFLIDQNARRRDAAKAAIERFLNLANEWQPKLETYSTYKERRVIWDGYWDGWTRETNRLTPEARRKWQDRTDVTVAALQKARAGVLEMKDLEKEAKGLSQPLTYTEGKLEEMRLDLELKIAMLVSERDKRFKDDR
jgi:hypothetical protein